MPGSLSGLAAWAAETAGSEPGSPARVRAGLRRRHQEAYLPGKHGNRLALLLGSSRTAVGTPETGSYVLVGDVNPHEQKPDGRTQPGRGGPGGHGSSPWP